MSFKHPNPTLLGIALLMLFVTIWSLIISIAPSVYAASRREFGINSYSRHNTTPAPKTTNPYQGDYGPPNCTWYAWQRLHDVEGIDAQFSDNANQWAVRAQDPHAFWSERTQSYVQAQLTTTPVPGDVMVLPVASKYAQPYHVAFVETGLDTNGYFTVSQQWFGHKEAGPDTKPYPWTYTSRINLQDLQTAEGGQVHFIHFPNTNIPPQSVDNAISISQSANLKVPPGQKFTVYFVKQNTGNTTWSDSAGYTLACVVNCMGSMDAGFDGQTIQPDQQWEFIINLTAPSSTGIYPTAWVMEHSNTQFGDATMFITITVDPRTAPLAQSALYVSTKERTLFALDTSNGDVRWRYENGSDDEVVVDGVVYFISGNNTITALNANDGKFRWQRQYNLGDFYSLIAANGMIYALADSSGNDPTSSKTTMYALDTITGNPLWHFQTGPGFILPTFVGNTIYISVTYGDYFAGIYEAEVDVINNSDGSVLWHEQLAKELSITAPVVLDNMVFVSSAWLENSSAGNIYAFNASNGSSIWHSHINDGTSSLAAANGLLYVGTASNSVYALQADNSSVLWSHKIPAPYEQGLVYPVVSDGVVYASSYDGAIDALQANDGSLVWQYQTSGSLDIPVVADGVVYLSAYDSNSQEGSIYALRASDGRVLWRQVISNVALSVPVLGQ